MTGREVSPRRSSRETRSIGVSGRIRRRLALAIILTALIPVLAAIFLAQSMVRQTSARFYVPEIGKRLDQSLELYQELARAVKSGMRHAATAIAANGQLRRAVIRREQADIEQILAEQFSLYPSLVSLAVEDSQGGRLGFKTRGTPLDPEREHRLEVRRALTDEAEGGLELVAVFSAEKSRFEELEQMSEFVNTYHKIERRRETDETGYIYTFAALLGITIIAAVGVGSLLARQVSSRIGSLAEATKKVGAGDLSIRVSERGNDEIADLAQAFNRMLSEVAASRARIEYLQRIGAWQEMARRLAHEIKNPLTPIQLAIQEIHRRYAGQDPKYQKLLDTTLEIIEDEVGTLRRLVSEFSNFARLPQAELRRADLIAFLKEQAQHLAILDQESESELSENSGLDSSESGVDESSDLASTPATLEVFGVSTKFELPETDALVYMDRQMLRRVLLNLVRNAAQAVRSSVGQEAGKIQLKVSKEGDFWVTDIDDNGPGVQEELQTTIFDPYVTTKMEGTGLGLAIVKKIVVEHGGDVFCTQAPLGGARFRVRIPAAGTTGAQAALESRDQTPTSSRRP